MNPANFIHNLHIIGVKRSKVYGALIMCYSTVWSVKLTIVK